ncbi:MAG: sigma-70 family RNA polymerase sigma factor [Planctomycetaceae bacterium]|nr:sigma-70 family RNA polymerase sigma factor [Planctomycetaceae bacterium]
MKESQAEKEERWIRCLQDPGQQRDVVGEIFEQYSKQLLQLIYGLISDRLASRFDGDDILQSVFGSFCRRPVPPGPGQKVLQMLVGMCVNKTRDRARFHCREKRDVRREVSTHGKLQPTADLRKRMGRVRLRPTAREDAQPDVSFDDKTLRAMAAGATPEQAVVMVEMFESLDEDQKRILNCRLQGLTETEIADQLGCTRRTVTRKLALIHRRLQEP